MFALKKKPIMPRCRTGNDSTVDACEEKIGDEKRNTESKDWKDVKKEVGIKDDSDDDSE